MANFGPVGVLVNNAGIGGARLGLCICVILSIWRMPTEFMTSGAFWMALLLNGLQWCRCGVID